MRNYSFILQSLGIQGLKTLVYNPNGKPLEVNSSGMVVPVSSDIAARLDTGGDIPDVGRLGHSLWANVILKSQDNTIELRLDNVLCELSQPVQIIKTQIAGRSGTVKEYISDSDWMVRLRGLLVEDSMYNYPRSQMTTMLQLLKLKEPLKVISEYVNLYGILNVVVENKNFSQKQGFQNVQPFDLSCISDTDIALIIKEGE